MNTLMTAIVDASYDGVSVKCFGDMLPEDQRELVNFLCEHHEDEREEYVMNQTQGLTRAERLGVAEGVTHEWASQFIDTTIAGHEESLWLARQGGE